MPGLSSEVLAEFTVQKVEADERVLTVVRHIVFISHAMVFHYFPPSSGNEAFISSIVCLPLKSLRSATVELHFGPDISLSCLTLDGL